MGAFFLYKQNANLRLEAVREVFENKGFREPHAFVCGEYRLLLWQKQLVECANWVERGDATLGAVGTVVYKALSYSHSLEAILSDFLEDKLETTKLRGNFCLIFLCGGQVSFLNDTLNVQHLFTDHAQSFITSSFLAAMNAPSEKLTLNRMACLQKLLTGYTVGPETLFNEIVHISRSIRQSCGWGFLKIPDISVPKADGRSRKQNIQKRAEKIREYLRDIAALKEEFSPEIGLSDGYDSRTLYAGALDVWKQPIAVHTHSTEGAGAHDEEKVVVKKMAPEMGSELNIVPTKSMPDYCSVEIDDILKDGMYYFDGRCAYNMGAFSPVYTRKYKFATAKNHRLSLNGLGGEMYRNYYMVSKPYISVFQWMKAHTYPTTIDTVVKSKDLKCIHKNLTEKISKEIGYHWGKIATNFAMRRLYSEVVMPDCDALNCNAHNQMLFYLTPFIEWDMVYDAYKARKALGNCGELQAGIMCILNHKVAVYPSHYGFRFTEKPPVKYRLYMLARGWMPDFIWNSRTKRIMKTRDRELTYLKDTAKKSQLLKSSIQYLERLFPEINLEELMKDYAMMPNAAYTAVLLHNWRDKIAE